MLSLITTAPTRAGSRVSRLAVKPGHRGQDDAVDAQDVSGESPVAPADSCLAGERHYWTDPTGAKPRIPAVRRGRRQPQPHLRALVRYRTHRESGLRPKPGPAERPNRQLTEVSRETTDRSCSPLAPGCRRHGPPAEPSSTSDPDALATRFRNSRGDASPKDDRASHGQGSRDPRRSRGRQWHSSHGRAALVVALARTAIRLRPSSEISPTIGSSCRWLRRDLARRIARSRGCDALAVAEGLIPSPDDPPPQSRTDLPGAPRRDLPPAGR